MSSNQNSDDDRRMPECCQSIFSETTCYDLIQQSAKVIVFEKTIPCHMAFYALIEHDANVAPYLGSGTTYICSNDDRQRLHPSLNVVQCPKY